MSLQRALAALGVALWVLLQAGCASLAGADRPPAAAAAAKPAAKKAAAKKPAAKKAPAKKKATVAE